MKLHIQITKLVISHIFEPLAGLYPPICYLELCSQASLLSSTLSGCRGQYAQAYKQNLGPFLLYHYSYNNCMPGGGNVF